jgi:hypothetical protein
MFRCNDDRELAMTATASTLTSERASAAVIASVLGGGLACVGARLGWMRVLVEAYRSCPEGPAEKANAAAATSLGIVALAFFAIAAVASLWGILQGLRKKTARPGIVALVLGSTCAAFGIAATIVPNTMAC